MNLTAGATWENVQKQTLVLIVSSPNYLFLYLETNKYLEQNKRIKTGRERERRDSCADKIGVKPRCQICLKCIFNLTYGAEV